MNESQAERVKFRSPWVDSIPLGWDQVKLGHISKIYSGGTPDKKIEEYWTNGTVPWLNSGTVNQGLITEVSEFISEQALANSSARWVPAGSLVMALAGQGKTKGMVAQLGIDATCNQSMAAIVIDDDHPRYMMYWLSSNYRNIRGIASDDTRDGLNLTNLKGILCPRPPSDEQIAIAAYLDAETKRIDELIAGKENLLELVEEIRLSTIYDVITKGLNSGIEMVETGVSWIGQAPAHWTVKSIKRLSTVKRGASPRPIDDDRYFDDAGEYGWVRIEDVSRSDGVLTETTQRLSDLGASLSVKLEPGKLFLSIAGSVGKPCISGSRVCIHDGFVYFPDLEINARFLFRLFESKLPFRGLGKMGTQLNLNTQTVGDIKIALPPANEIEGIVDFLESKIGEFNKLRKHVEHELEILKELRAVTITDAVLGRIDVSKHQTH